jgi:uncharacterized protein
MSQYLELKIASSEFVNDHLIISILEKRYPLNFFANKKIKIIKKSLDARGKQSYYNYKIEVFDINDSSIDNNRIPYQPLAKNIKRVIIIGAGPAGLFAALQLIELGIKPIIIERGKDVRSRRRDLATLNKEGIINEESNYCFGEGGAGTYSDGKLYTRSNKRGNIKKILETFVQFGADDNILYEAHPHIGTNKLPQIITAMREAIIQFGGEVHFNKKLIDFNLNNNKIESIATADGDTLKADAYILATGHSARDIFELLHKKNIEIEAKPFALGVRIEHQQSLIDHIQYKCDVRPDYLPPASYSLVQQVNNKGVFSFCMCPGGIIATASTANNELVVNGWSPSKRNNAFANSGMVVEVNDNDLLSLKNYSSKFDNKAIMQSPLRMMYLQQVVEQKAFQFGGGNFKAPAQRVVDLYNNKESNNLPDCSYLPGLNSANLHQVLPEFVSKRLAQGVFEFGKKLKGYFTNDAVVVATESRTSSPVKIPRDVETLQHPQITNLYPCGEGAGYAGGIISAAMDGERCANTIAQIL